MYRLLAHLYALKGIGWFVNGTRGPFPGAWQGWLIFTLLIFGLAATVPVHERELAWLIRVSLFALYLALGFWTQERDGP